MSHDLVVKALEEHGQAVKGFRSEVEGEFGRVHGRIDELQKESDWRFGKANKSAQTIFGGMGSGTFQDVNNGDVLDTQGRVIKKGRPDRPVNARTEMFSLFTDSEQFKLLGKGAASTGRVMIEGMSLKALTNEGQGAEGSTGYAAQPQRAEGLYNDPRRSLTLLSVLPSLPVTSSTFEYMRLATANNLAAFQIKEGDQKAETNYGMELETANIATVAHWTKASAQVLDDTPALSQKLLSLLEYGVLAKLEAELILGVGGQGRINGLFSLSTSFTPSGVVNQYDMPPADRLGAAVVHLQASGWVAGLILMNPVDWHLLASERDADGQYVLGSPRDPSPLSLWGVPVVLSPSCPRNAAMVLDPAQIAILDRQSPTLMASREDGNNFTSNMVTLLGEMRVGLAVFASGAVLLVQVSATNPEETP
ncbi:HK97 family phage major capsid protein [Azomonas agilis]|uniref:HK97 family phage major capsid protein n=1 Tax=Azomonas agilis TaxID=116849 RepID=A0A562J266_9GAMM|nr:phage major capsid protein [Azomonas agilis]TWH77296.1 HK97 family phage major capsid protein [Azomonas agilis]